MSVDLYVLFNQPIPSAQIWQAAAKTQGLPLYLDTEIRPNQSEGAFPVRVGDVWAAPQMFVENGDQMTSFYGKAVTRGPWRHQVHLSSGRRPEELVAAIFCAVSLATLTNGVVFAPDNDLYEGPKLSKLLDQAEALCPKFDCVYNRKHPPKGG